MKQSSRILHPLPLRKKPLASLGDPAFLTSATTPLRVNNIATVRISSYVPGYTYLTSAGFKPPYGDYFQLTVDQENQTQMDFGEGPGYNGPGNIWTSHSIDD